MNTKIKKQNLNPGLLSYLWESITASIWYYAVNFNKPAAQIKRLA